MDSSDTPRLLEPQPTFKLSHVGSNGVCTPRSISPYAHPPLIQETTLPSFSSSGLNVVIPIGGIGSRFQKEGYRFPKPLINIVGRPMICWLIERLTLRPQDTLWIAINDFVESEFLVGQSLAKWFPSLDIRLLRLHYMTKGATETVRETGFHGRPLISLNP
jgi:hypothetical protein